MDYIEEAKTIGFDDVGIIKVENLVVVPEYRKFCEDNLCGNYGTELACPPNCGEVEELMNSMNKFEIAIVLNTTVTMQTPQNETEYKQLKKKHNILTELLMDKMKAESEKPVLMMSAGPWKDFSCMSAYCVDAQKMADAVGMKCWENDGRVRFFSLLLFTQ